MEAEGTSILPIGDQFAPFTSSEFHLSRIWREFGTAVEWEIATKQFLYVWNPIRSILIVPLLQFAVAVCVIMTVMILLEKLFVGAISLVVKIFKLKPEKRYKWELIKQDEELGSSVYPTVLVQIPMYNEKEVYKHSIGAACALEWPSDRLMIQVLDDSTDTVCKDMVELECQRWKSKGVNIMREVRNNRKGYKAGALKEGLKHDYVEACEYIAIFDADFQPESDFLLRTVPFLMQNPEIALVQTRWRFVNADECLMTRLQEMSLDYHFKIEQEAGSFMFAFFGFNGTAGVWRTKTISDAGGWKDRTTVEDMDLAVRAGLRGWKFVYVGDVQVKSELPSTFKAYRFQQHRWSCGPTNLFKKMAVEIIQNKKVSFWKKVHLIYDFFFLGKFVAHTVTFIYYCVVIPLAVFFPEVVIPFWGVVYVPTIITLCKCMGTPSSFHLVVIWVLFENVMSLHRLKAAFTGLFESERVNEWIVTEKLGDANKINKPIVIDIMEDDKLIDSQLTEPCIPKLKKFKSRLSDRLYYSELIMGILILFCGYYDIAFSKKGYFLYLIVQGAAFLVVGFGYVGTPTPNS
ncbi:putative mannan synthase 11 isoform X1 [Carex littledalei]|uniref:glucomannan 4-beta-mannosyltransferase n=1 Tax=Carex littledalei TaxID=544730 RepID=A0A833QRP2_9POAL|nr:putative mannan synthase 11 isoform X1 [Carex littledalei]